MKAIIEQFVGVTSERKQVKIIKITEPINGYPGKYKIPSFKLSTGEHLNLIDKENMKFSILGTNAFVWIVRDQKQEK